MKDLWIAILVAVSLGSFVGCEATVSTTPASQKDVPTVSWRTGDPNTLHFFKDEVRVDGKEFQGRIYREENDEVICYGSHETGFWCHWKASNDQH